MKNHNKSIAQLRIIHLAGTFLLILLSLYAYIQTKNLIDSSNWITHTNEINLSLERISTSVLDAETNQKSFLLIGDSICLQKRDDAFRLIDAELLRIDSLTNDNPAQIKNLQKLRLTINAKKSSMEKVMNSYRAIHYDRNFSLNVKEGVQKTKDIKAAIKKMGDNEEALLNKRTERFSSLSFLTPLFAIVLFFSALSVLLISYFKLSKAFHESTEMQARLEAEKTFAQTILDSSADNIVVLDNELRYIIVNPKAHLILEKITPNYIGKKVTDVFPNTESLADMHKALAGEIINRNDFYSAVTGLHFEATFTPLIKGKDIIGVIAISRDITGVLKTSKLLEQQNAALEERNEFVEKLLDASADNIVVVDKELKYISANRSAQEKFALYYNEDVIGKKVTDVAVDSPTEYIISVFTTGSPIVREKVKSLKFDKYYQISYIPLTVGKQVNAVMIIKHEITDTVKKQDELEDMNKELQSFTQVASHDLREPLRKIQAFGSRILEKEFPNLSEEGKGSFKKVLDAASRMQTLIEDLLTYSRASTDERNFEKMDLNIIFEDVKDILSEEINQKGAIIEYNDLCEIRIIPFQFRQLMHNLIGNALKFSKPGVAPHIVIKAIQAEGSKLGNKDLVFHRRYCHISVTDNGIGFDNQYSQRIFEVFQRLHSKSEIKGTGIGLSIVKKIVENHDGIITAKSTLNEGATFDIYIPVI